MVKMPRNLKIIFLREENGDGQGEYHYPDSKYVGEWKKGKPHGKGELIFYNGNNIEGQWRHGEFIGFVTYIFPDCEIYIGGWKDGERHRKGTTIYPDGSTIECTYKCGERFGKGEAISNDGFKYIGEYKNDKFHGQGSFTYPDGGKYV